MLIPVFEAEKVLLLIKAGLVHTFGFDKVLLRSSEEISIGVVTYTSFYHVQWENKKLNCY